MSKLDMQQKTMQNSTSVEGSVSHLSNLMTSFTTGVVMVIYSSFFVTVTK